MLSVFSVFKYLNVSVRMSILWKTLQKAGPDLLTFLVFFFIVFMGFVVAGHLMFGPPLADFRNLIRSFFACFRLLLGDLDIEQLETGGNRVLAPLVFLSSRPHSRLVCHSVHYSDSSHLDQHVFGYCR